MSPRSAKLSKALIRELERIEATHVIVAAVLNVKRADLDRFVALKLDLEQGRTTFGPRVLRNPL